MLPLWKTVKKKNTVDHKGSIIMKREEVAAEKKVKLVKEYLSGKMSQKTSARLAGVSKSSFQQWVKKYEAEGDQAFYKREEKRRYSPETKQQAVEDYLGGKGSQLEICKKYRIRSKHQLQNWIKVYNGHGDFNFVKHSGGGSYMKKARSTTQEERLQIARECLENGKNYGELALRYNVSYQQVRTWTQKYKEFGEAGLEDRRGKRKKDQEPRTELEAAQIEIERLKHQLYLAEMENRLLKKLDEIVRRDASDK